MSDENAPFPSVQVSQRQATIIELRDTADIRQDALYAINDEGNAVGAYPDWLAAIQTWVADGSPVEGATRDDLDTAAVALTAKRTDFITARLAVANAIADMVQCILEHPTYAPPSPAAEAYDLALEISKGTLPNSTFASLTDVAAVITKEMTDPEPDEVDVPVGQVFVFEFSDPVDPDSMAFQVSGADSVLPLDAVSVVWTEGNTVATVTFPTMNTEEIYTAAVSGVGANGAGIYWVGGDPEFTTLDVTAPAVASTSPANGATLVALDATLTVTFDDEMDEDTIIAANVKLVASDGSAADVATTSVALDVTNKIATLTMAGALTALTVYKFKVTTDAEDTSGNACTAFQSAAGFTTAAA